MKKPSLIALGLLGSFIAVSATGLALAANGPPPSPPATPAKSAEQNFRHLSADGMSAFKEIHLARLAIFDGKIDEANKLVNDARVSLGKAKTDDAAFLKAEAALRGPAKTTSEKLVLGQRSAVPITWIPINAEIVLGDTFQSVPDKAAAVEAARKSLAKGDSAKALQVIKLESLDVDYTLAVAPLEDSIAELEEASTFMAHHDYYAASQSLRTMEAGIRYDEIDDVANVSTETDTVHLKTK